MTAVSDSAAWWRRANQETKEGRRATIGTICPECIRLVPRIGWEGRRDLPSHLFCQCGNVTTAEQDFSAHGIDVQPFPFSAEAAVWE